jgi:osmoprotectant transport system ATP-binding protein
MDINNKETMIQFKSVFKNYGKVQVLKGINLSIYKKEIVCLVGLSGSGKTTLLRTINRLNDVDSGNVYIEGQDILSKTLFELRSKIGYVIQSAGLFDHMDIEQNLMLVRKVQLKRNIMLLKEEYKDKKDKESKVELKNKIDNEKKEGQYSEKVFSKNILNFFKRLHLREEILYKKPYQISGGQKQRIGIIRALLVDSEIILMDEPFSALDPIVRKELQILMKKISKEYEKTIILVSHDPEEALYLGDRIVLLDKGKIKFEGKEEDVRESQDKFIRKFFLLDSDEESIEDMEVKND